MRLVRQLPQSPCQRALTVSPIIIIGKEHIMTYLEQLADLMDQLDRRTITRMQLPRIARIIVKVEAQKITDPKIELMIHEILTVLEGIVSKRGNDKKTYWKLHRNITRYLRTNYDLVPNGYYIGMYLPLGLALGTGLGVAMMGALGEGFLAVGIGFGLAISLAAGASMDASAKKEGRTY